VTIYHVDGELVPASAATVSVRDRGFLYGDAAFETVRVYGGDPFAWDAHADRLRRTCRTLGFADALPGGEDLLDRIRATVAANDLSEAYARVSVTRGVQSGKLTPDEQVDPTVVVIVKQLPRGGVEGTRVWEQPADLRTVDRRRVPDEAIPAAAQTHNYLNGILARLALRGVDGNPDESLLCTVEGTLTEGATSNLFFVTDGTLRTPTAALPLLPGVTRGVVLDLAEQAGIETETGRYEPAELSDAREIFLTNSTWELRPVTCVDGTELGVGPVTTRLQALFDERIETEHY
jgi:branched-chain amino acid aminotransferase